MKADLLICGASTRAAAFSALRAGLQPCCIDLFADADLRAHCPVIQVPRKDYPGRLAQVARHVPVCPWMYTGGLENHPRVVRKLSEERDLWGNNAEALKRVRHPGQLMEALKAADLPSPEVRFRSEEVPADGTWLFKPHRGSGGRGIRIWRGQKPSSPQIFFQKRIDGNSHCAVYVGDRQKAKLLGVTEQLVGEPWLHAQPFSYCGSISAAIATQLQSALDQLGKILVYAFKLQGLFGVDFILGDGTPWTIEVNPRYTASIEVLEHAFGVPALSWHRGAFNGASMPQPRLVESMHTASCVGKAILFAKRALVFTDNGPWRASLDNPLKVHELPAFADIPAAGTRIRVGWPILTFFVRAANPIECRKHLRRLAHDLDRLLYGE